MLIAETPDRKLNLSETYVLDTATGDLERIALSGDIPAEPLWYEDAEWAAEYPGNVLEEKPEKRWVLRVYFIAVASIDPFRVDMERVYLLDGARRTLSKLEVRRLAPPDTPPEELRVRIRDRSVVIDTATSLPGPEEVVRTAGRGLPALSKLEKEAIAAGQSDEDSVAGSEADDEAMVGGQLTSGEDDVDGASADVLYDDDTLKDFLVEVDDESEADFEEYDMPDIE